MKTSILVLTLTILELSTIGLAKFQLVPNEVLSILTQLPIVGLFGWYVLHSNKQNREWLDHLLETQNDHHQRTLELFDKIFERMDIRQNQMADRIELLTRQLAVNSSTINEAMRINEK